MKRRIKIKRGQYGEIIAMPKTINKKAMNLLNHMMKSTKMDEHGGWNFGLLDSEYKKGRTHAINYDFYGVGYDLHNEEFLAVIQIREFYRQKSSYYPEIRKNYFLLGRNEDGRYFAHPVESRVIHFAIRKGNDVIKAVQNWIFGADYSKVLRQGDICLLPVKKVKGDLYDKNEILMEDSHQLTAEKIFLYQGNYYCVNPSLVHLKNTHPSLSEVGSFMVIVGNRTFSWSFASPTLD